MTPDYVTTGIVSDQVGIKDAGPIQRLLLVSFPLVLKVCGSYMSVHVCFNVYQITGFSCLWQTSTPGGRN